MKKFLYGLLFGLFCIPILEELVNLICGFLEIPKAFTTKKILKENKIINDMQMEQQEISTNVIGFQYEGEPEYYNEDDDFKDKKSNKIKCGF